jgi:hypothetical protein
MGKNCKEIGSVKMICDTCKQRYVCDIRVSHVVNNGCRLHIEETKENSKNESFFYGL